VIERVSSKHSSRQNLSVIKITGIKVARLEKMDIDRLPNKVLHSMPNGKKTELENQNVDE